MNRQLWLTVAAALAAAPSAWAQADVSPGPVDRPVGTGAPAGPAAPGPDLTPGGAPERDSPPPLEAPLQPHATLGVEALAGASGRLDGVPDGYSSHEAVDMTLGVAGWWAPSRRWSMGLGVQRAGLGSARSDPSEGSISAGFDLNTLWLVGRWYPVQVGRRGRFFVGAALGPGLQELSASGLHEPLGGFGSPEVFSCSALSPAFSFRAGPGFDIDVDQRLAFVFNTSATFHVMESGVVNDCARGLGPTLSAEASFGFVVRFDAAPSDPVSTYTR